MGTVSLVQDMNQRITFLQGLQNADNTIHVAGVTTGTATFKGGSFEISKNDSSELASRRKKGY